MQILYKKRRTQDRNDSTLPVITQDLLGRLANLNNDNPRPTKESQGKNTSVRIWNIDGTVLAQHCFLRLLGTECVELVSSEQQIFLSTNFCCIFYDSNKNLLPNGKVAMVSILHLLCLPGNNIVQVRETPHMRHYVAIHLRVLLISFVISSDSLSASYSGPKHLTTSVFGCNRYILWEESTR